MAFQFSQGKPFETGDLFLGLDPDNAEIGIRSERHALTIAGAGSGKGAAVLIQNARRWTSSICVVDPKGENAEHSWQEREAMGQLVGVVDPFRVANIPDRLRVSINPLSMIDPDSLTARADILAIADGLVVRHNPQHAAWDEGAAAILAGVIAFVIGTAPLEHRTLSAVRRVLLQSDDDLNADAQRMAAFNGCGGLTVSTGRTIITALTADKGMEKDCLGGARTHTQWIDDPAMAAVLDSSTFDLAALKTGTASLYLVIPPQYLDTQGAFLRLFVRSALNAMANGNRTGGKCLFLLDEFYSLGRLDIVAKAAGLMRSYGVQLWVFLQDLGQLQQLYGEAGAETFFGNADVHMYFGNSDALTLETISKGLGDLTPTDIADAPPEALPFHQWAKTNKGWFEEEPKARERWQAEQENTRAKHSHNMGLNGKARLSPSSIGKLLGKGRDDAVASAMIVFAPKGQVYCLRLAPYFQKFQQAAPTESSTGATPAYSQLSKPQGNENSLDWAMFNDPREMITTMAAFLFFHFVILDWHVINITGFGQLVDGAVAMTTLLAIKLFTGFRFFKNKTTVV